MNRFMARTAALSVLLVSLFACDGSAERRQLRACMDSSTEPRQTVTMCSALLNAGGLKREDMVQAYLHRGSAFGLLGNHDKSMADFNRVVELDPASVHGRIGRGHELANHGELDAAMRDFQRAIELDPNAVYAVVNVATIYELQGDWKRSLEYFERSVALAPEFSGAVGGRCWALAVLDRELDKAVNDCTKALALPPQDNPAFTGNQLNSRGFAYFRQKKFAEAIADYDRSLELAPESASSYYVRGIARRALGDHSAGDADIARARQIDPNVVVRYAGFGVAP
jgi:tetratricopeptide (TPR) repeat protein